VVEKLLQLPDLDKRSKEIIAGYPNTYAFSKALTEHELTRKKGDFPLSIVRPTIIGPSAASGWIEGGMEQSLTSIAVAVGLIEVLGGRTVVAGVADIVTVRVYLLGVGHRRAIVAAQQDHEIGIRRPLRKDQRAVREPVAVCVVAIHRVGAAEREVVIVPVTVREPERGTHRIRQVHRQLDAGVDGVAVEVLGQHVATLGRVRGADELGKYKQRDQRE
jgi:hypothetical protein